MNKVFTAIGLMSGTSCDGVDASIIQSDGEDQLELIKNHYIPYDNETKNEIINIKRKINDSKDLKENSKILSSLEKKITLIQIKAVNQIIDISKYKHKNIDLIGFHGQTIYHSFKEKISKQLADANMMYKETKIKVVFNFRELDMQKGGQGAPLSPIYHKAISKKLKIIKPTAFINIGGISNITFIDNNIILKSFDCGAGNYLIDQFLKIYSNNKINFDKNGELAFKGVVNEIILENYLNNTFFDLIPPKTLDVNDFSISMIRGLSLEDSISTLSEFTARTIVDSFKFLKEKPTQIILTGGGRKNNFIFNRIRQLSKIKTVDIDSLKIDGDFVESQAFAYIAIRSLLNKPISFFETTGVKEKCVGGNIINSI